MALKSRKELNYSELKEKADKVSGEERNEEAICEGFGIWEGVEVFSKGTRG